MTAGGAFANGRRRAVVTGASTGIGAAFAARLAAEGFDLLLVARTRAQLESTAVQLRMRHGIAADVCPLDLAHGPALRVLEEAVAGDDRLAMLINNAGSVTIGCFDQLDPATEEVEIYLNLVAPLRLTHAALPGMLKRGSGAVINVASIAAFVPGRYTATYSASKAALLNFTEALHEELRGTGVRVQALCPGFTHTELMSRGGVDISRIPAVAWMTPEAVVDAALAGLWRGGVVCVPGWSNRVLTAFLRVLPRRTARRLAGVGAKRGWAARRHRRSTSAPD